jgi:hypothetical protein
MLSTSEHSFDPAKSQESHETDEKLSNKKNKNLSHLSPKNLFEEDMKNMCKTD